MSVVDYVLDGLERWLEVERECGARVFEVDRSLLTTQASDAVAGSASQPSRQAPAVPAGLVPPSDGSAFDFVFLHDRPLAPAGVEMMAKIVLALGKTAETAPVVVAPPIPKARAYVVLGALALRKYFPGLRGEPGQWVKSPDGEDVLITYSPAFILRFPTVTDAVVKIKRDMWNSLKGVMKRVNGGSDGK